MKAVQKFSTLCTLAFATVCSAKRTPPPHSWDSHIHVIEPEKFPLSPDRDYTPKTADRYDANDFETGLGIEHAVIVLPSIYGTDNSVLLDALNYFNGTYRGVCVVDPDAVDNETLQTLHDAGVRGVRANYGSSGTDEEIISSVKKNAAIAKRFDWVVELWVPSSVFKALRPIIPTLGVRVVADHFAHATVGSRSGDDQDTTDPYQIEGFSEVIDMVKNEELFVKLSAPYRTSKEAPLYEDMRNVAKELMFHGPNMVVYASDWPHTGSEEGNAAAGGRLQPQDYRDIDDAELVDELINWAASDAQVQQLFVDNPRRLWQWESVDS